MAISIGWIGRCGRNGEDVQWKWLQKMARSGSNTRQKLGEALGRVPFSDISPKKGPSVIR